MNRPPVVVSLSRFRDEISPKWPHDSAAMPTRTDDHTTNRLETTINNAAAIGCKMPNAAKAMPIRLRAARNRFRLMGAHGFSARGNGPRQDS